ncbi:MAG: hypothetical protein U1F54_23065 [Burkholderiales bacterium]
MAGRFFSTRPLYTLTITGTQSNVNVRTAVSSPSIAGDVLVTLTSSGVCNSTSAAPALRWGTGWPAGCTFKLMNAGSIRGSAGVGGAGGATASAGSAGTAGNNAMDLDGNAIAIDNGASGQIFGGGGGGGGGGGAIGTGGGGGGGGQGDIGTGSGGAGGSPATYPGSAGTAGSPSGAGVGGAGGSGGAFFDGGGGGYGGGWGDSGTAGASSGGIGSAGGAPGAGGKAINLNGGSVTWIAGNNATQVRGGVS